MTQPAKVQEPSMEEILASIRRIIADDEAKPAERPVAAAPAAPPPKPVMKDVPPSAIPAAAARAAAPTPAPKPAPPPPAPPPPAAAAASNNQDDIDAMLASLEEDTAEEEVRKLQPDGDVFELTDEMALPDARPAPAPPPAVSFSKIDPQDDLEFTEARAAQRHPMPDPSPVEMPMPGPILSRTTVNAVESAFNTLAHTVLSNNARTLEDLVKEMLRPMLKSWLDDNLPGLVERIVKAEIERVSRGR
jgi:uncharacterized protein